MYFALEPIFDVRNFSATPETTPCSTPTVSPKSPKKSSKQKKIESLEKNKVYILTLSKYYFDFFSAENTHKPIEKMFHIIGTVESYQDKLCKINKIAILLGKNKNNLRIEEGEFTFSLHERCIEKFTNPPKDWKENKESLKKLFTTI